MQDNDVHNYTMRAKRKVGLSNWFTLSVYICRFMIEVYDTSVECYNLNTVEHKSEYESVHEHALSQNFGTIWQIVRNVIPSVYIQSGVK